jgi:hypothetical protein
MVENRFLTILTSITSYSTHNSYLFKLFHLTLSTLVIDKEWQIAFKNSRKFVNFDD